MNYQFPVDTCVVACSGPSLNKVDVFSLGLPVCAISTAIRTIKEPHYWFIADHLNEMHGQEGKAAWVNPNIMKIVPNKTPKVQGTNIRQHPYREGREANQKYETLLLNPSEPLLRGPHKTLTFAIQWLHISGVKNIIFAGNDLQADSFETKYAYSLESFDKKKQHNFKKTLDQIKDYLKLWYPVIKSKGCEWYSWECGDVFKNMVPEYNQDLLKKVETIAINEDNKNEYIETSEIKINDNTIKELKDLDRNRIKYRELINARKSNKQKSKTNMQLYFDLLHKRKK